jgi:hypothetical protein
MKSVPNIFQKKITIHRQRLFVSFFIPQYSIAGPKLFKGCQANPKISKPHVRVSKLQKLFMAGPNS